jgi:hypothetical protein
MGAMPPQQPIDLDPTTPETVLEFGSITDDEPAPSRRRSLAAFGRALVNDRRLVPLAAVLGGVAAFASLISEWQVTTVNAAALGNGEIGNKVLPSDLADLGAFGGGYLAGLFLLVGALVLTLFGPAGGRRYTRLAGLAVGGTQLGVLVSLVSLLGDQSRIFSRLYTIELSPDQLKVAYGRGLWCALVGVTLALVALYLAGPRRVGAPVGDEATEAVDDDPDVVWSWRRPRADEEAAPEAPFDLTVTPAQPFTSQPFPSQLDDHDRPAG